MFSDIQSVPSSQCLGSRVSYSYFQRFNLLLTSISEFRPSINQPKAASDFASSHSLKETTTTPPSTNKTTDPEPLSTSDIQPREKLSNDNTTSPRTIKPLTWTLIVLAILAALFLFSMDQTLVANVQPNIIKTLGEVEKLPWISVAYGLGGIASNPTWGKIFAKFDNKLLYLSAFLIFEVGSAICGAAQSMDMLIVARAICGIGGMGVHFGAINIISFLTSKVERAKYIGYVGMTYGAGTFLGPIIGGAFADSSATWRWAFYINLCVGGATAPTYLILIPSLPPLAGQPFLKRLKSVDFIGATLIAEGFTTLLMAIACGGSIYNWNSGQIISLFVLSVVFWIAFPVQQLFFTKPSRQLFPFDFVKSVQMDILFACTVAAQIASFVCIFFLPLHFQFVRGDDSLQSGIRLLPLIAFRVTAVIFNGVIMAKHGWYMLWFIVGGSILLIGITLLYTLLSITTSAGAIYGYSILTGLGIGLFAQAPFSIAQQKVEPQRMQEATAFIGVAQIGGIALVFAISNSMFVNEATRKVGNVLPDMSRDVVRNAITGVNGAFFDTLSDLDRVEVLWVIDQSIRKTFIFRIVAAALVIVLSVFMKRERLFPKSTASKGNTD